MNGIDVSFPHIGISIENLGKNFSIFGFSIAYYGVLIALGMVAGILIARWQAKRMGEDPDIYSDFALYAIIFAIIGARLYFVIFTFGDYVDNLWNIFNTRGGGLAIYGGVIGGVLTAIVYCYRKKYSVLKLLDVGVIGLILGQAIGRWGNFMNREAFGGYTDSLFAMRLKVTEVNANNITSQMKEHSIVENGISYIQVHPTFLYESVWCLVVLAFLIIYSKRKHFQGEIFILYVVGYGLGRFFIEGLRTDQLILFNTGIPVSQLLSGIMVVVGVVIWIIQMRKVKLKTK